MAKLRGIDVSDASSITLLIHGVGDHSGLNIGMCAKEGFENSELAKDLQCDLRPAHLKRGPWSIDNLLVLTHNDKTHYVLPCIWSGFRLGQHASVFMISMGIMLGVALLALVSAQFLLATYGPASFGGLFIGAMVLDGLAFLGRDKNNKSDLPLVPFTILAGVYVGSVFLLQHAYPWFWTLPALVMLGVAVVFAIPTFRCVLVARSALWKTLILVAASGICVLLASLGLVLGSMSRNDFQVQLEDVAFWDALQVLCLPFLVMTILGILFYILRFFPLELILDVTRYVGNPVLRESLLESFGNLLELLSKQAPNSPIWVVSHSLGTVAASHGILETNSKQLGLITMGSPLVLMSHVFPGVIKTPESLNAEYAQAGKVHFWVNLWRQGDVIGRALHVSGRPFAEMLIGRGGHGSYWKDARVWHAIVAAIRGRPITETRGGPDAVLYKYRLALLSMGAIATWSLAAWCISLVDFSIPRGPIPDPLSSKETLRGSTLLPDGSPIAGLGVVVDVKELAPVATDAKGNFVFSELPAGEYTLRLESPELVTRGDRTYSLGRPVRITVAKDRIARATLQLKRCNKIRGRVVDPNRQSERILGFVRCGWNTGIIQKDGSFSVGWIPNDNQCTLVIISPGGKKQSISIPLEKLQDYASYDAGEILLEGNEER